MDEGIMKAVHSLSYMPHRGRDEESFRDYHLKIKFILFKENKNFELKIFYVIDEFVGKVFVTDIFPTKMNPTKIVMRS